MEAQQPQWREEEAQYSQLAERDAAEQPEKVEPPGVELSETSIAAEGILLHAERAANRPIDSTETGQVTERELELRHEVQDDADNEVQAISVGEVLAGMQLSKTASLTPLVPEKDAPSAPPSSPPPVAHSASTKRARNSGKPITVTYAQAVKVGFIMAIVLIAVFALLQLLV